MSPYELAEASRLLRLRLSARRAGELNTSERRTCRRIKARWRLDRIRRRREDELVARIIREWLEGTAEKHVAERQRFQGRRTRWAK